jgi:hypothetical protein
MEEEIGLLDWNRAIEITRLALVSVLVHITLHF